MTLTTDQQESIQEEPTPTDDRSASKRWFAGVVVGFLLGAIIITYPLILHLGTSTPSKQGDSRLTTYILAWDAHALAHSPTRLFQAPFFYPARDALAYTDHSVGLAFFSAPIYWVTGNFYLAYNIVMIGSIAFAGVAAALLGLELIGDKRAAVVAGAVFAFSPYWFGHVINLAHIQILATGWIPLCLFGIHRWLRTRNVRWLGLATLSFVMAALTSWYQGIYLAFGIAAYALILLAMMRPKRFWVVAGQAVIAGAIAAAVLAPFSIPYRHIQQRDPNFVRTLDSFHSATPTSYLAAPQHNLIWGGPTQRFRNEQLGLERTLFPGAICIALALVGALSWKRLRAQRAAITAAAVVVILGVAISLGAHRIHGISLWAFLFHRISVVRSLRVPARAHMITIAGLAILAAAGTLTAGARLRRRTSMILCGILVVGILVEGLSVPIELGPVRPIAPVYKTLATRPGAVLELPTGRKGPVNWTGPSVEDVDYMLYETAYWGPLANGVAGYRPSTYAAMLVIALKLPAASALSALRSLNIRTLILHTDTVPNTPWSDLQNGLAKIPSVSIFARSGPIIVYSLDRVA